MALEVSIAISSSCLVFQLIGILIHYAPAFWPYFERLSNIWPQFSPPHLSCGNHAVQVWCSGVQIAIELTDLARIRRSECCQGACGAHRLRVRVEMGKELTGYRNSGSRTNWNSRDASHCVSRNWASRNSPSGTNTNSHGAEDSGGLVAGGARGEAWVRMKPCHRPQWRRMRWITSDWRRSIKLMIFIAPPHSGHSSGSTS